MHALRHDILPPSGVEFAVALNFTPSTTPSTLINIVTARSNLLRVYDVREQHLSISDHAESERDKRARVRKGTEAVEGEVEMDQAGEGWVNMGAVKVSAIRYSLTSTNLKMLSSLLRSMNRRLHYAFISSENLICTELSLAWTKFVPCPPTTTNSTVSLCPSKMQRYYIVLPSYRSSEPVSLDCIARMVRRGSRLSDCIHSHL
jgi:hypothetical protein